MEGFTGFNHSYKPSQNGPTDFPPNSPQTPAARFFPNNCIHSSMREENVNEYGPEEAAKLDAVLASVNQLIDCLNVELNDESCDPDRDNVMASQDASMLKDYHQTSNKLKDSSSSRSASPQADHILAGASKQELVATDNTTPFEDLNANGANIKTSGAPKKENKECLIEGNALIRPNRKINLVFDGAETSCTINSVVEENKTEKLPKLSFQEKQMATLLLKSPRMYDKESSSTETMSLKQNEELEEKKFHSRTEYCVKINTPDLLGNSTIIDGDRPESINLPSKSLESGVSSGPVERKKLFRKANSENSSAFFLRDSVDSGTFSIDIDSNSVVTIAGNSEGNEANLKLQEKPKLKLVTSLPGKATSYKENQIAAIKALLPKRKISKDKEQAELKKLTTNTSNCSCFQLQENGPRKNSSSFELKSSASSNISSEKQSKKNPKPLSRRKTFLTKQKKFGLYFRRSQSFDAKNPVEEIDSDCSTATDDGVLLGIDEIGHVQETSNKLNIKKQEKLRLVRSTSSAANAEPINRRTLDRMRVLMNKSSRIGHNKLNHFETRDDAACLSRSSDDPSSNSFVQVRKFPLNKSVVDDEERTGYSSTGCNEFTAPEDVTHRRRATMDATTTRSRSLSTRPATLTLLRKDDSNVVYSSLPRKLQQVARPNRLRQEDSSYSMMPGWLPTDSDGSLRGSQDSLDDADSNLRNAPRQRRIGKQYDVMNEQIGLDSFAKLASKIGKKNKLRKTLKKSSSLQVYDVEEMAERKWSPAGDCTWSNMNGMKVDLGSTRLQSLSELESDALQKVSLSRLQDADLGVNIVVPKDESKILKRKVSMKKKYGVHLSSKDKNKDKNYDHVFGIPLVNVVENDQLLRLQKSASFANSLEYQSPEAVNESSVNPGVIALASSLSSSSSSCSGSSSSIHHQPSQFNNLDEVEGLLLTKPTTKTNLVENLANDECVPTLEANDSDNVFNNTGNGSPHQLPTPNSAKSNSSTAAQPLRRRGAIAADSINELDKNQTSLLQALSLSMTGTTNQRKEKTRSLLPPTMPSVPYVVQKCCDHIKKYGLHVTGIFRIAGSKKRVKQLREEFDRGMDVTIEEDYNPHDVAALLKEFFRDLPEALLTRELYPALIQTAKQVKQERLCNLRYLVWLLPLSNRDTLHTLLNFLALVATHSETSVDRSGQQVPGNKMNISNLATIFGPNILHRHKKSSQTTTDGPYQVQSLEKPEDSSSVIKVVEDLITYQAQLFQIPKEDHNDMLRTLKETDPEAVDFLLRRKAANHMREKSHLLNNSCSPTTSKSDDQSGPMDSKANVSSQSEQIEPSNVCEAKQEDPIMSHLNNNTNEGDAPRVYSSMRLSYQQATGHAFPPAQAEKTDLTTKLKFIRPIFKKAYQQPKSRTNPSDAEASYNYTPCEMDYQETNSIAESSLDRRESTGSFLSINTKARSMSFTDDDLQQIFGQKNGQKSRRRSPMIPSIQEFRCSDEYCDNTDSEPTFQRATEVDGEKFEHAKCTENKIYFMKNETSSSIKLSDTKSSVDCTEGDVSSSEVAKRRGGFSVQPQMKREHIELATSVRNDSETKRSPSTRQRRFRRLKKEQDSQLSADNVLFVSSQVDAYATGTGVVSNSAAQNDDTKELSESRLKTNKDKFNFITTMHIPVASRSDYNNNNSNNNNSNETYKSQKCQVLKLRPSTISTINVVLSPGTKDNGNITYQTNSPFLTSNPATNESSLNGASVPKPSPRRRLQNSLSPRIQRQYKPASSLTLKHNLHSENFSQHKLSENQTRGGDRDVKLQSAVTTYTSNPNTKGCEAWKTTKDVSYAQKFSTANNAQDNDSVAETKSFPLKNNSVSYLARRYSKDDLALTKDSKHAPGSRWTSAGLLGTAESNHSACLPHHITKEENKLNSNSNKEQMTWHDIFRDKQHLPETLV